MELTVINFLIVCPLVFIAGFIDAVAGGGGLISLPAYMISGIPVHYAIGTNKVSSCMGTTVATYKYAKDGYINYKLALLVIPCAVLGSNLGAHLALMLNTVIFTRIMLFILPLTALYILKGKPFEEKESGYSSLKTAIISSLSAFIIGIYDGFYGPGTGTFLILILTGLAHLNIRSANGISKAINLTTNITAVVVYVINAKVVLPLGLTAGLFSIAGNYLGSKQFSKEGGKFARPVILMVITIFIIKIITEMF